MVTPSTAYAHRLEDSGDDDVYRGEIRDAKSEYGQAIDAYVELGDAEGGIRTCRKLIRLAPDVVRTRYTLLCLLSAQRRTEEAKTTLADYLRAVKETGTGTYAVPRLVLLGAVVEDASLRESIGAALQALGAEEDGANLVTHAKAAAAGLWPGPDPRVRREQIFRLARL